ETNSSNFQQTTAALIQVEKWVNDWSNRYAQSQIQIMERGNLPLAESAIAAGKALFDQFRASVDQLKKAVNNDLNNLQAKVSALNLLTLLGSLLLSIIAIVVLCVVFMRFLGRLRKQLTTLERITDQLGAGKLGMRIPPLAYIELHKLGENFNSVAGSLQEQQRYNRLLIEASIDPLMTTDLSGIITDVNPQMCKVTSYSREELIGTPFKQYTTNPEWAEEGIYAVQKTGHLVNYELMLRTRDGETTLVSYNATVIDINQNQPRILAIARDITEYKQLENQLQQKNRELQEQYLQMQEVNSLKSEFLANMSHELRTPLNCIIGFAQLMYEGMAGPLSDEQEEYLGDVLSSAKHLLRLINDVLDLAKIESGTMSLYPEQVNLQKLTGEVCDTLRGLVAEKRICVDVNIDSSLEGIVLDSAKLKQVLYNYLSNAIKFTPEEGHIQISIRPEGEDAFLLEVEDTGVGIAPEDQERLFIEFQQLDSGPTKKFQGTGLGLALTKHIVEAQRGTVGVRSTPGQGSTFYAVLPRVVTTKVDKTLVSRHYNGEANAASMLSALVIEHHIQDQVWLAHILEKVGFRVEVVPTGSQASKSCQERTFDVITLDLLLPDISGWDVLEQIRAGSMNQKTPVIVISRVKEKKAGKIFPISDMLTKPISFEELLASLRNAGVKVVLAESDSELTHA
ncbi:MAG: ATP-binding protein, partial [Ktedonobacteraceae bacterium]